MAKQSNVYANSSTSHPVRRPNKRKLFEEEEDEGPSYESSGAGSEEGGDLDQEDEGDSDMDPEKPHAVAWEDDEEVDEGMLSDPDGEESVSGGDEDDEDVRLIAARCLVHTFVVPAGLWTDLVTLTGMASLPFGTLLQAKKEAEPDIESDEDSTSESDKDSDDGPPDEEDAKPTDWKIAADRKAVPKRVTKTAPAVETSKKPVSRFRQIVEVKKM
ncbi:hypothetical protein M407DRAFT_28792, partial [Tulasnella calospora MUT 4182]